MRADLVRLSDRKVFKPADGNYKVVVDRWDEAEKGHSAWTLYRRTEKKWVICRRDEPADEAIFNLAEQVEWYGVLPGEYSLTGSRLDTL